MNCIDVLLRTHAVALSDFHHPVDREHSDPDSEVAVHDSINFVEDGSFHIEMDGESWRLDTGTLFIASRGMGFSCRHEQAIPTDRCLCLTYDSDVVEDLLRADVAPLRPPATRLSPRLAFLRHRLRSCEQGDELKFELLAGAIYESVASAGTLSSGRVRVETTHLMRRVGRAIDLIEASFGRALRLRDLASAAGLSDFHFARAFKSLTGMPPHRYLTAVRLRHAAQLLDDGASVSFTCYEVGFGSLSHFVTAFKRRYGVIPSEAKRRLRHRVLRAALSAPVWGRSAR